MDPVSIAAGTAGIVSLGLQICGGLVTYCKAWRSHDGDVEKALERLTSLSLTLESLEKILSAYGIDENDTADSFRVARDKIYSCTANLNTLHSVLVELESIGEPAGVLDKIHNIRLRSIALFNKEKFRRLQDSIKETQLKLDSAMQILQLQLDLRQISTLDSLATVHRETADQIPRTIEHVVNRQLDLYGRHWSTLQQDTASQHAQALQDLVQLLKSMELYCLKHNTDEQGSASPSDVDENGNTVFHVSAQFERRKKLEVLARATLDAKAIQSLRLSNEAVLDGKASRAISMLREKTYIPPWLINLTPEHGTVYHISDITVKQAQILWDAGFREIDELDELGVSPLMALRESRSIYHNYYIEYWNMVVWLLAKGADLHRRQKFVAYGRDRLSNKASSTAALHYLAAGWGMQFVFWRTSTEEAITFSVPGLEDISEQVRRLRIHVLTDSMPDSCNCACSATGCRAFTMMVKLLVMRMEAWGWDPLVPTSLQVSQGLAQLLDVDKTGLEWLRREMIRFNTFQKLDLRHTCCRMDYDFRNRRYDSIIYEPYDDQEIQEIQDEQAEDMEKLEALLIEFENKYEESGSSLQEFLGGYWSNRMKEVLSEEGPVDHEALENMGIVLRK
ncbi:MAG: hypothetical protein Q9195_007736 [Heterodermia aff. obscurata]